MTQSSISGASTQPQKPFSQDPTWNGKWDWPTFLFLIGTPIASVICLPFYIYYNGVHWIDLVLFISMYSATAISITAGYHRCLSHKAFDCHPVVKFLFLVFGSAAVQRSAYIWCSDHRYHHRFVDKKGDPYNIKKGFFYAHLGWMFRQEPEGRTYDNIEDLKKDKLVMWQYKYSTAIILWAGFLLPTVIGAFFGRPFGGLLWGGLLRMVALHHSTWLVNSAAHWIGGKPYSKDVSARDSWLVAFLTFGEGFHNFHHCFAADYRNGYRWYQWDPTKWLILSLNKVKLTYNLKRTPKQIVASMKEQAKIKAQGVREQAQATAQAAAQGMKTQAQAAADAAKEVADEAGEKLNIQTRQRV